MKSSKRNQSLDAMRAGSVMLVVLAHAGFKLIPGGLGVTIFFVISGFIITKLIIAEIERTGNFSIWNFYARRFWKIFPPLAAIILIPTLITWSTNQISLKQFASQVFFYYNWNKISHQTDGVLLGSGIVWSLSIEEQFYIVVAIITYFVSKRPGKNFRKKLLAIFLIAWTFSTMSRIYFSFISEIPKIYDETANIPRIYLGTDTRLSSICAGAILAIVSSNEKLVAKALEFSSKRILLLNFLIIFFYIFSLAWRQENFRDTFRFTLQELGTCFLIFVGPVLGRMSKELNTLIRLKFIQLVGLSSYCIYLSHLIIILLLRGKLNSSDTEQNILITVFLTMVCLVIGISIYYVADKPFDRFRMRFRR